VPSQDVRAPASRPPRLWQRVCRERRSRRSPQRARPRGRGSRPDPRPPPRTRSDAPGLGPTIGPTSGRGVRLLQLNYSDEAGALDLKSLLHCIHHDASTAGQLLRCRGHIDAIVGETHRERAPLNVRICCNPFFVLVSTTSQLPKASIN
jgi:hypothetical protein